MATREVVLGSGIYVGYTDGQDGYADGSDGLTQSLIRVGLQVSGNRVINRITAATLAGLTPSQGQVYIVTDGADANKFHVRDNSAWFKITPQAGCIGYDETTDDFIWFDAATWQDGLPSSGGGGGATELTISSKTSSYTLQTSDFPNVYLDMDCAGAEDLIVPDNADEAIPIGSVITGGSNGAGQITIVEDTSVTVLPPAGCTLVLVGQGSGFSLTKIATNVWKADGQFEAI